MCMQQVYMRACVHVYEHVHVGCVQVKVRKHPCALYVVYARLDGCMHVCVLGRCGVGVGWCFLVCHFLVCHNVQVLRVWNPCMRTLNLLINRSARVGLRARACMHAP